jgi:pimeloyl-ACP methyl ester carboxylesterase
MRAMLHAVDSAACSPRRPSGATPSRRGPRAAARCAARRAPTRGSRRSTVARASKDDLLADLVRSLLDAGRTKVQKDFDELVVEPFSEPDPKPLQGLVPPSSLADADSKFVTVEMDGVPICVHYKESLPPASSAAAAGANENVDALVCMHGANGSTYSFRHLLPRVAAEANVRTIAIDRPPYGLTSRPPPPPDRPESFHRVYSAEGAAELTLKVMSALGVERAALLGHSAGAPVALDAALLDPPRCAALLAIAPAVFVGDAPEGEADSEDPETKTGSLNSSGGGGLKLPLDRALRFAWFRFLVSQNGPGLNVVRGSVRRQTAAVESGATYGDLDRETRDAYVRPTLAEGWDVGLLQLFRAGLGSFGGDGARLRREMPRLCDSKDDFKKPFKALVVVGAKDETTPPRLAESLRDALARSGVRPENLRFELLPSAAHLPMEQTEGGVRETFEALVVEQVKALK